MSAQHSNTHTITLTDQDIKDVNILVTDKMLTTQRELRTGRINHNIAVEEIKLLHRIQEKFSIENTND